MLVQVKIHRKFIDMMGWQPHDFGLQPSVCSPDLIAYCKREAVKHGMAPDSPSGIFPNKFRSLQRFDKDVFVYEVTGPASRPS